MLLQVHTQIQICKFKAKDSGQLSNVSKKFSADNIKTWLYGYVVWFVNQFTDVDDVLDVQNYLMKKHNVK